MACDQGIAEEHIAHALMVHPTVLADGNKGRAGSHVLHRNCHQKETSTLGES